MHKHSMFYAVVLLVPLLCASCGDLSRNDRGTLQPQTVSGPCDVKKFYILAETAVHTDMVVRGAGQACSFTVFNPNLQIILNAAFVTSQPSHGQVAAQLITGTTQAQISYTPQPGYAGPDKFTVTLEPDDLAIAVAVAVQPPGA